MANGAADPERSAWFSEAGYDALADGAAPAAVHPETRAYLRLLRGAAALVGALDANDAIVALGLILLARGCYLLSAALGWIAPGAVLLWYGLPKRPRFVEPKPPTTVYVPSDRLAERRGPA